MKSGKERLAGAGAGSMEREGEGGREREGEAYHADINTGFTFFALQQYSFISRKCIAKRV